MQQARTRTATLTETLVICDRCGREMLPNDPDCEHQERIAFRFRAGYGSVFGDGSLVEADLCQRCVIEMLGPYLRVTEDDPFEPKHLAAYHGDPKRAYQQYQLREVLEAEELLETVRKLIRKRPGSPDRG